MSLQEILQQCKEYQLQIMVEGDDLRIVAKGERIPDSFKQILKQNKSQLHTFLSKGKQAQQVQIEAQADEHGQYPLSHSQQGMWIINKLTKDNVSYNQQSSFLLEGELNVDALKQGLNAIVGRHGIFRTRYFEVNGEPRQQMQVAGEADFTLIDLSGLDAQKQLEATSQIIGDDAVKAFNLSNEDALRMILVRHSELRYVVVVSMHHIAIDEWSNEIFAKEFSTIYAAFAKNLDNPLTPLQLQFSDYALWQHDQLEGQDKQKLLDWWTKRLADAPTVHSLPLDKCRPKRQSFKGHTIKTRLCDELSARLNKLARFQGCTAFNLFQGAFAVLLGRYSNQQDIVMGTPVANRINKASHELIGYFSNIIGLRTDLSDNPSFYELLSRVVTSTTVAMEYQQLPFEILVDELSPERDLGYNPLFQVMLSIYNYAEADWQLDGIKVTTMEQRGAVAKFDLSLNVEQYTDNFELSWNYAIDLFEQSTIERMMNNFVCLLESIVETPELAVDSLKMVNKKELEQIKYWSLNSGREGKPAEFSLLHQGFEAQVKQNRDAIAVVYQDTRLTYGELNSKANKLAHHLCREGVSTSDLVGICIERCCDMVVSILAVLKAGAGYVPLDPAYPEQRLQYMVENSQLPVVIFHQSTSDKLSGLVDLRRVIMDQPLAVTGSGDENNLDIEHIGLSEDNNAYMIYTSGSTGNPKGVLVGHRQVVKHISVMSDVLGLGDKKNLLLFTSMSFDASVETLFMSFANGSTCHVLAKEDFPANRFWQYVKSNDIAYIHVTPSYFSSLSGDYSYIKLLKNSSLKVVNVGGEEMPLSIVNTWHENNLAESCRLFNTYGPTEAVITATTCEIVAGQSNLVSLGNLLPGTQGFVVDSHNRLCPQGVVGELLIGGDRLAKGYINSLELTAERFVDSPVLGMHTGRVYRTGDLVRWLSDGTLEYYGRIDDQVKINGLRIELGEIESFINDVDDVSQVVVKVNDQKQLVAYVVSKTNTQAEQNHELVSEIKTQCGLHLPQFMVPEHIVCIQKLPITPSGKVDWKALPKVSAANKGAVLDLSELNATELQLVGIWKNLLEKDNIDINHNFFQLGGQSLLAIRLVNELQQQLEIELSLSDVFENATITTLARLIDNQNNKDSHIAIDLETSLTEGKLSYGQQRIWFIDRFEQQQAAYNILAGLQLNGKLDTDALISALEYIFKRHQVLHTIYRECEELPTQKVNSELLLPLTQLDLTDLNEVGQTNKVNQLVSNEAAKPFDLANEGSMRASLIKLSGIKYVLLLTLHHIAVDESSLQILFNEFKVLYEAKVAGEDTPLAPMPTQYLNYAQWQRERMASDEYEANLSFWSEQLEQLPACHNLPLDKARPSNQSFAGARLSTHINKDKLDGLIRLASEQGATFFIVMQAVFSTFMARLSNESDVVFGIPTVNRDHKALEPLIGLFMNTLVVRNKVDLQQTFVEHLKQAKVQSLNIYNHQEMPFELLVEAINPERSLAHSPLFQVMLLLETAPSEDFAIKGLDVEVIEAQQHSAKYDLTLALEQTEQGLSCVWEYASDLFEQQSIAAFAESFAQLVNSILATPQQALGQLNMVSNKQLEFIAQLNETTATVPGECIHELFEQQVALTPEATALCFEGESLSYKQLNDKVNAFARYMLEQGIGSQSLVGIHIERSTEMMISILSVLKAGNIYVPLDPNYPESRLRHMLVDSGLKCVLTHSDVSDSLQVILSGLEDIRCIAVDTVLPGLTGQAKNLSREENTVDPSCLSYVMYTSGSTGKPKGIMIEHQSVVNFFVGMDDKIETDGGRWLASTSISFDISVLELFYPLTKGMEVLLAADQPKADTLVLSNADKGMDFSLFYFASVQEESDNIYQLMLDGAKFADHNHFKAVWTPERHFAKFGGLYPNPAITSAAIATVTSNLDIRAGSCVLPLHNPIRVAEDWSMIDNLSSGRAGIAVASGWQPNDFVIAPDKYEKRHQVMLDGIETLQSLWQGESVNFSNGQGMEKPTEIFPRPVQPSLPVWITIAGDPNMFRKAGEIGANVLTHLLGQSVQEVEEKIRIYREARAKAGHSGEGCVTLMMHTFIADTNEQMLFHAKDPFKNYLKDALDITKEFVSENGVDVDQIDEVTLDRMMEQLFNRYARTSALLGTAKGCQGLVDKLKGIGVNEIACLIDFGPVADVVKQNLVNLNRLRQLAQPAKQLNKPHTTVTQLLDKHDISHFQCTPSMMSMLLDSEEGKQGLKRLKQLMLGGEALPLNLIGRIEMQTNARMLNMYGPTETTIWSSIWSVNKNSKAVRIGRPIANTEIQILDNLGQVAPVGVVGHLYIGGNGLARGYLNRTELTSERFIDVAAGGAFKSVRLYNTGDLARLLPDGNFEYFGRSDSQTKIRGHRIELGEIENQIDVMDRVKSAVVLVAGDTVNDKKLLAYIELDSKFASDDQYTHIQSIREGLSLQLPNFMMPSHYFIVEQLPLTPNGKIDKLALANMDLDGNSDNKFEAPSTTTEIALQKIWQEILSVDKVGVNDSFFILGGHSLSVVRMLGSITQQMGVSVSLKTIFQGRTIKALASVIDQQRGNGAVEAVQKQFDIPYISGDDNGYFELSYAQRSMWVISQFGEENSTYNEPTAVSLQGPLDRDALTQALESMIERHETLRTVFELVDEKPMQRILSEYRFELGYVDLRHTAPELLAKRVDELAEEEANITFDLTQDLMLRAKLLQLSDNEHVLLATLHHIAKDGWSGSLLIQDLSHLYSAYSQGQVSKLENLDIRYVDYVQWQKQYLHGDQLDQLKSYWSERLAGIPQLHALPLDKPRPSQQNFFGSELEVNIDKEVSEQLNELCRQSGITLFMLMHSAFSVLLHRYSGETDIIIGSPVANRPNKLTESMIGVFVNNLVLRSDLTGDPVFNDYLKANKENIINDYAHQNLPFDLLVDVLNPDRSLGHSALFQVMLSLNNNEVSDLNMGELTIAPLAQRHEISKYDLTLNLEETADGLVASWEYASDLFMTQTIERLAQNFNTLLSAIVTNPSCRVSELPMVSNTELGTLKELSSDVGTIHDEEKTTCMHELFEQWVEQIPEQTAVTCGNSALCYAELNKKANQLAHHLRDRGVVAGDFVGLCVERSVDMVVGMLAIVKAGAAYLPLDPNYPAKRLEYMLEDSGVDFVIVQEETSQIVADGHYQQICINNSILLRHLESMPHNNLSCADIGLTSESVAYMMYTSGSTGRPKGVLIPHKGIVIHLRAMAETYGLNRGDRILMFAPINFDTSVEQIFIPLTRGLTCCVIRNEEMSAQVFWQFVRENGVTWSELPPSYLLMLMKESDYVGELKTGPLRILTLGGEIFSPVIARKWQRHDLMKHCQIFNNYGPTEVSVTAMAYPLKVSDTNQIPLGDFLGGVVGYVVDKNDQLCPIGVTGELLLAGPTLAKGYHNNVEKTAASFVPNPVDPSVSELVYRTGDLVRWTSKGELEFIGRADNQVKIRGFRIELGEVESHILESGLAEENVVLVHEFGPNNKQLVAYVSLNEEGLEALIQYLRDSLPDYLVPSHFVVLEQFPLMPNGKIDRDGLGKPVLGVLSSVPFAEPDTETEEKLLEIWLQLLDKEKLSVHDNFFHIGGHSLLAIQLLSKVNKTFDIDLPLQDIFIFPILTDMALAIDGITVDIMGDLENEDLEIEEFEL